MTEDIYDYLEEWERSDIGAEKLDECHSYTLGDYESTPTFPRFDAFMALQPDPLPRFDGKPDAWKAWSSFRRDVLFGGNRITRYAKTIDYVAFPECELVNRAIISCVLKAVGVGYGKKSLFENEFARDLAAHLALDGVHRNDDGSFDVRFLNIEAQAYIRKSYNATSVNNYLFKKFESQTKGNTEDA